MKINVGQIEKHRINNKTVPANQMSGNSAVCLNTLINDKGNYGQKT